MMGRNENRLARVERAFDNRISKVLPPASSDEIVRRHEHSDRIRAYLGESTCSLADYVEHSRRSEQADACEMLATGCTRAEAMIRRLCVAVNGRGANTTIEGMRAFCTFYYGLMKKVEADMLAGVPVSESAAAAKYFRYRDGAHGH